MPVVVKGIAQHRGLQRLIDALLAALNCAALQQLNGDSFVLHAVPHMAQFRGYGANGDRVPDLSTRVGKLQQIAKLNANPLASRRTLCFNGDLLRTNENIGVVPVYEDFVHLKAAKLLSRELR